MRDVDTEVRAAAAAARLDEVVERLPGGWTTNVGEGGALLSGGERQRVSIARALLKDAPVVLLVAHRMRTVQRADRVVFLHAGRIVEEGPHDELLSRGGRYADFWNLAITSAGVR